MNESKKYGVQHEKLFFFFILLIFISSTCVADEMWQNYWEKGRNYFLNSQHEKASFEFNQAISSMTSEEIEKFPYVLLDKAENEYALHNYEQVLEDTEKVLKSENITDHERLSCGVRRLAVFMQLGDEDAALNEYKKYVINCPLFPKYNYFKEKIVIRDVPNCTYYQKCTQDRMLANYCKKEEDIHKYENTWIIDITKNYDHSSDCQCPPEIKLLSRTPEEVEACCNTCNRLATAANFICGCLPVPPQLGGPITAASCRFACIMLVEDLRQECEKCCNNDKGKCAKTFESWKKQFKKENPGCGKPPVRCP